MAENIFVKEENEVSEYETVEVYNPTDEEFISTFNGQRYRLGSKAVKQYPTFLAFHIAKHLSDSMLFPDLAKFKKDKKNSGAEDPRNGQLMIYDNVKRRQTLFDVLRSKELVQKCILAFPFKGFVGEMSEYDEYVEKQTAKKEKSSKKEE